MKESRVGLNRFSRREFFNRSAAVAAFTVLPRYVLGGRGFVPPSDRINIAMIGVGGQGVVITRALFAHPDVQIIAIADPNEESDYSGFYYGGTAGRGPAMELIRSHLAEREPAGTAGTCTAYVDYREMLEKEQAIDAVVVATPDHAHAVTTMAAIHLGKHVYCEKPLTRTVAEARRIAEAAREAGVATQMGNQGHSGEGIRQTCEWIWDGAIGTIREVHAWTGAGGWAQDGRPSETPPVPEGLDWDLWLGPAHYRPYHPVYAPFNWRGWWSFGTAAIGDMACHNLDPAFWALHLGHPVSVEAIDTHSHPEIGPAESTVRYEFPARGTLPPVTATWYDGPRRPPRPPELEEAEPYQGNGILFIGEKGVILCGGWGGAPTIYPTRLADSYVPPEPSLARSKGHHRDWLDACKGGPPASSSFDVGGLLTEVVLLGNIAQRIPGKIHWDGASIRATSVDLVDPPYREGWSL